MCLQAFIQRVEQRKLLLDLAVSFYTHTKEVSHKYTHVFMYMHKNVHTHTLPCPTFDATARF